MSKKRQVSIPIFVPHGGCPHRCSFCDQRRTSHRMTMPAAALVRDTVMRYRATITPQVERVELAFFGGSFTALPSDQRSAYLAAAASCRSEGLVDAIRLSTRPDAIDGEILAELSRHGVSTVELGVQSFDDEVLRFARRGHGAQDSRVAARAIVEGGFDLVIQLMPGLPRDTDERSLASAREAASLGPAAVRIYPTVVLDGTDLADRYRRGEFVPLGLDEAIERCADCCAVFDDAGIPVIRLGLHPLDPSEVSSVLAGPYHPAFGHLVRCRQRRRELMGRLAAGPWRPGDAVIIRVPQEQIGQYRGPTGETAAELAAHFQFSSLVIEAAPISGLQIGAPGVSSSRIQEAR